MAIDRKRFERRTSNPPSPEGYGGIGVQHRILNEKWIPAFAGMMD